MRRKEYLESMLTKEQISILNQAVRHKRPILITSECDTANGKSTLVKYLRESGAEVYEPHEMVIVNLDKKLENMVNYNILDTIVD